MPESIPNAAWESGNAMVGVWTAIPIVHSQVGQVAPMRALPGRPGWGAAESEACHDTAAPIPIRTMAFPNRLWTETGCGA